MTTISKSQSLTSVSIKTAPWEFQTKLLHYFFTSNNKNNRHFTTCKQCGVTFFFTKGEQWFFQGEELTQPVRCPECRNWIRESEQKQPAKIDSSQDSPSGPKLKSATVAWAMREGWWTEATNAEKRTGMQARGTKQCKWFEDTPRELPWIETGSLVRDFRSAVEYGGIP